MAKLFSKAVLGGVSIGVGSIIYLRFPSPVGAAFFSAGLLMIMVLDFKLYTGVIGSARTDKDFAEAFIILLGNLLGCFVIMIEKSDKAKEIVEAKMAVQLHITFIRACLCGGIIYSCVRAFQRSLYPLVILFVAAFILSGAEHSIADFCYIISAEKFGTQSTIFMLTVIIGNLVGAQLYSRTSV